MVGSKHAILVGINSYGSTSGIPPLQYAEKDAQALAEIFQKKCGFSVELLLGQNATRDAMEKLLLGDGKGGTLLFFFAGHGQSIRGDYKLHPADSDASGLKTLSFRELTQNWQLSKGYEKVLAILDACRSELGGARGAGGLTTSTSRDIQASIRGERWLEVLYGCREGQASYEIESLKHGLLTRALMEVLENSDEEVDSGLLAGAASDWMRRWCQADPRGRMQEAHRYHRPSIENRIILVPGKRQDNKKTAPQTEDALSAIHVITEPEGADVMVDGKSYGKTPLILNLSDKEHTISVTKSGFRDWEQTPVLPSEIGSELRLKLEKLVEIPQVSFPMTVQKARQVQHDAAKALDLPVQKKVDMEQVGTITFQFIPPGSFVFGADNEKRKARADEKPAFEVDIERGFYISQNLISKDVVSAFIDDALTSDDEVLQRLARDRSFGTNVQGGDFIDSTACVNVSARDAAFIAEWLSDRLNLQCRLPTEAEWEYAARAGKKCVEIHCQGNEKVDVHDTLHAFGLSDISGKIAEWTCSPYTSSLTKAALTPCKEKLRGGCVIRGGGMRTNKTDCIRFSQRGSVSASRRCKWIGFRLVCKI